MMKMMSQKNNLTKTQQSVKHIEDTKDPESLQKIGESEEEFDANGDDIQSSHRQSNHIKTFYRKFCSPCYYLTNFISVKWKGIKFSLIMLFYGLVPLLAIAAILFYWGDNPKGPMDGSWSWWLIFIARLLVCFVLAQLTQFVIIDFICLETQIAVRFIGRLLTLMAVQAKGWPVLTIFWSMWQLILLHGPPAYNRYVADNDHLHIFCFYDQLIQKLYLECSKTKGIGCIDKMYLKYSMKTILQQLLSQTSGI